MSSTIITDLERKIVVNPTLNGSGAHLSVENLFSGEIIQARLTEKERQSLIDALQNSNLDAPTAKIIEAVRYGVRHVMVQDIDNDELYWSDAGTSYTAEMVRDRFFDIAIIKE